MREYITLLEAASKQDEIEIVKTSYGENQLAPVFSGALMRLHYGKLAHGYAERFNKNEGDRNFNYAGAVLHNILFTQFRPPRTKNDPNGPIGNLIKTKFKSWDAFKDAFEEEAMKVQGSGWVYLARDGTIKRIQNHQIRQDVLILVDLWEHAFQMDYGSNKQKYLDNIWKIIDWNVINSRWAVPYKQK
jgi:Fe-Mn family superoxide dismutase